MIGICFLRLMYRYIVVLVKGYIQSEDTNIMMYDSSILELTQRFKGISLLY